MKAWVDVTFDAAHRLHAHNGLCKSPHGHTYRLKAAFSREGEIDGNGMVVDFGDAKKIVRDVVARFDHAYLHSKDDPVALFLRENKMRTVMIPGPQPTAECMAKFLWDQITKMLQSHSNVGRNVSLSNLKLYETPTSYVELK